MSHIILDTAIIHADDDNNITDYAGGSYAFHSIFIHNLPKVLLVTSFLILV